MLPFPLCARTASHMKLAPINTMPSSRTPKSSPTTCRAPTETKTAPQTPAVQPSHTTTSHTCCCHHTHTVVTTPDGLLLRALVCCRIYAFNRNFQNMFQEYLCSAPHLHLLNAAVSLEEAAPVVVAVSDSEASHVPRPCSEYTMEGRNAAGGIWGSA